MNSSIVITLSKDRFETYLVAAGHDPERALRLHIWNAQVGEAFHVPIQVVELALRNRINSALTTRFGRDWWSSSNFLNVIDEQKTADLNLVLKRIAQRQLPRVTGQVVAGLSFGFWIGMLRKRYHPSLWSAEFHRAFPSVPKEVSRERLLRQAIEISSLRNRISHHEPIFKRDLLLDFSKTMSLLNWICPETQRWIRPYCRVPIVVRQKP